MKINNAIFLVVLICTISIIRVANCRPKPSDDFKGNQLEDREETCQRCAKATKSPDAYPECKSTDRGYRFCYEFVSYGSVQADNNNILFIKELIKTENEKVDRKIYFYLTKDI